MNKKLTLQLNKDVIEMAKFYARSKQTSLSILVENYFRSLANEKKYAEKRFSPIVQELSSIIELPDTYDLKDDYTKYLIEKYS